MSKADGIETESHTDEPESGINITRRQSLLSVLTGALLGGATLSGSASAQAADRNSDAVDVGIDFPGDEKDGVSYELINWEPVKNMYIDDDDSGFIVKFDPVTGDEISEPKLRQMPDTQLTAKIGIAIDRDENPNRTFETVAEHTKTDFEFDPAKQSYPVKFTASDMQLRSIGSGNIHNLKNHSDSSPGEHDSRPLENIIPGTDTVDGRAPAVETTLEFRIRVSSDQGTIDAEKIESYTMKIGRKGGFGLHFGMGFGAGGAEGFEGIDE